MEDLFTKSQPPAEKRFSVRNIRERLFTPLAILFLVGAAVTGYFLYSKFVSQLIPVPIVSPVPERYVDTRTQVEFVFILEADMFPGSWLLSPTNAFATPLDASEVNRSISILAQSISKYPETTIRNNLKKVYVVKRLNFSGIFAGGTATPVLGGRIYMANEGTAAGYSNAHLEWAFHSELSTILKHNYSQYFNLEAWLAINSPGFQYGAGGGRAVEEGKSASTLDSRYFNSGFLHQYATADVEEDYNSIVSHLWANIPEFWSAVYSHEKLRQKTDLAIQFYTHIHPLFTESYFRNLPVVLPPLLF